MGIDSTLVINHEQSELDPLIPKATIPTRQEAYTARAQFLALCWSLFLIGWNDGSTGPLLPKIQKFYNVKFAYFPCVHYS